MHFATQDLTPRQVYALLIGLVAPRPIALVTSRSAAGVLNAAPFSAYNYLGVDPPIVALGVQNRDPRDPQGAVPKDTARNIRETREFVVNVVTEDILAQMNVCAVPFPPGVNELEKAGLHTEAAWKVSVPRIREAHASLECREHSTIEIGNSRIILGEVVAFHVDDAFVDPSGPYVKSEDLHAVGRMNGLGNYVRTQGAFLKLARLEIER